MEYSEIIDGYRVIRLLGKGGMGEVYEVETGDGRRLALKVFAVNHGAVDFLKKRFLVEGKLLQKLADSRLVHVDTLGIDRRTGRPYFTMDLVLDATGKPQTLEDARIAGLVTEEKAGGWYEDLCRALSYCHAQGIVHRDVKLTNVLINAEGHAILSDFGVSRIFDPGVREELQETTTFVEGETTGTRPVMGSYWFLAPELRKGGEATAASDWYALGVTFFRLLTGMWYEPGTDALELLAPYDPHWKARLERLLDQDPRAREPLRAKEQSGDSVPTGGRGRRLLVLAACLAVVGIGGLYIWLKTGVPVHQRVSGAAAKDEANHARPFTLAYDATTRFSFCACPPGTSTLEKVAVCVTRPYWLAATPVTRRAWFAVRGESCVAWPGGEEAPMTYVSRAEVTNFCARLTARFARELPEGYEIRLPTIAEWRLAWSLGRTEPPGNSKEPTVRKAREELGWYGQNWQGLPWNSNMEAYYRLKNRSVVRVKEIWPDFPPRVIPNNDKWESECSTVPPVPVGLKPANELGLHDLCGNCFERVEDTCDRVCHFWGKTEWGVATHKLYLGLGLCVTNPVERSGALPLMLGNYFSSQLPGDLAWSSEFDRMPYLGFRLCIGPTLN